MVKVKVTVKPLLCVTGKKNAAKLDGGWQAPWGTSWISALDWLFGAVVTGLRRENHANNSIWRVRLVDPNVMQSLARALHVVSTDARRCSIICEPYSVVKYADTTNRQKIELQSDW
jgi:hypothetical protein